MAEEHKFATKLREKQELADQGDVKAQKYLDSGAAQVLRDYLDPDPITGAGGVPESRGGGLGAIRENDPVLSAGSEAAQLARRNLLFDAQGNRRGNLTAEGIRGINIPLMREGLTNPNDYFRFNQMLYSPNIEEYEKARPISSGKSLRDIITMATPAKYIKKAVETIGQTVLDVPERIMGSTMVEEISDHWKGRKKGEGFKGLINNVLQMTGIGTTDQAKKFTENIQIDETDQGENIDVSLATIKETNENKINAINEKKANLDIINTNQTIATPNLNNANWITQTAENASLPSNEDVAAVEEYINNVKMGLPNYSVPNNLEATWQYMLDRGKVEPTNYFSGQEIVNQVPILHSNAPIIDNKFNAVAPANMNLNNMNFNEPLNYEIIDEQKKKELLPYNVNYPGVL